MRMKQKILLVGVAFATSLAAFNAVAQTKTQRMIVMLDDGQVARKVIRGGERIENVFVDQRNKKNPKLWAAVSLPAALLVRDLENQHGARAEVAFGAYSNGFAANLNEKQISSLRADPRVKSVFPDATGAVAGGPPPWVNTPDINYTSAWTRGWNIFSIGADTASSSYRTDGGYPVKAFVLDTGVQPHYDLNYDPGTSFWSFDTHGNPDPYGNSCSAHATHVAGIIGAYRSPAQVGVEGVAPGAVIWSMRIVNYCSQIAGVYPGLVYLSSVLTAINAIEGQTGIAKEPNAPLQRLRAVANMSVLWDAEGGELFIDLAGRDALRATMKTAVENGVFFSVAGGNGYRNAKNFYPAAVGCALYEWDDPTHTLRPAVGGVMGVGAIHWMGEPMNRGAFENKVASYGGCVKIWAPGQSVPSTVAQVSPVNTYPAPPTLTPSPYPLAGAGFWNPWGGTSAAPHNNLGQNYFDEMSGSSMAAPHIAGAALLFAKKRQSLGQPLPYPWEVENFLLSRSTAIGPNYGPPGESAPVNLINVSGW